MRQRLSQKFQLRLPHLVSEVTHAHVSPMKPATAIEQLVRQGRLGHQHRSGLTKQLGATITVAGAKPGTKVSIVHPKVPVLISQFAALGGAL